MCARLCVPYVCICMFWVNCRHTMAYNRHIVQHRGLPGSKEHLMKGQNRECYSGYYCVAKGTDAMSQFGDSILSKRICLEKQIVKWLSSVVSFIRFYSLQFNATQPGVDKRCRTLFFRHPFRKKHFCSDYTLSQHKTAIFSNCTLTAWMLSPLRCLLQASTTTTKCVFFYLCVVFVSSAHSTIATNIRCERHKNRNGEVHLPNPKSTSYICLLQW